MKTKKQRRKEKQIKLRNKKLIKKYPFLKPYNVWTGKIWKEYDYEFTWYDDFPTGWRISFGKMMLDELKAASSGNIRFEQIKEKFGALRIYASCNRETHDVIDKYETISRNVCIKCGKPDVKSTDFGWVLPLCRECCCKDYVEEWDSLPDEKMQDTFGYIRYSNGEKKEYIFDCKYTADKIRRNWNKHHKRKVDVND